MNFYIVEANGVTTIETQWSDVLKRWSGVSHATQRRIDGSLTEENLALIVQFGELWHIDAFKDMMKNGKGESDGITI